MAAASKKSPRRGDDRAKGRAPSAREKELLEELNKGEKTAPAQLLGSAALAIKIRGVISTQCPSLDRAIGRWGYPLGRLILLHGKEGSGKTTLALHGVAETQRLGGMAIYVDSEHKLDPDYAAKIGVDLDRLVISQPDYIEKFMAMVEKTIVVAKRHRKAGIPFPVMVVLDSINSLPTKAEFEAGWEQQHIAPDAGVYSSKLKKLMPLCNREDVALLFISQEREKVGVMFGRKERTGGGKAPRYYSSLILEVARLGAVKVGDEVVGNLTQVKCSKNQIAPPFRTADFKIMFGKGIDYEDSLLAEGLRVGVVKKAGAWYSIGDDRMGQGEANAVACLRGNLNWQQKIKEALHGPAVHRS